MMDIRTRYAVGGIGTVAASIAVVCAVAMTTSVFLADARGSSTGTETVVLAAKTSSIAVADPPARTAAPTPSASPVAETKQQSTTREARTIVAETQTPSSVSQQQTAAPATPQASEPEVVDAPDPVVVNDRDSDATAKAEAKINSRDSLGVATSVDRRKTQDSKSKKSSAQSPHKRSAHADGRDETRTKKTRHDAHKTRSDDSPDRRDW